jgi:hypothetical protein
MARRFAVDTINLEAYDFEPFVNEKYMGVVIRWDSDIGFGEYTIYKPIDSEDDKWLAQSEHMDNNEDKDFIKELMKLFIENLDIVE